MDFEKSCNTKGCKNKYTVCYSDYSEPKSSGFCVKCEKLKIANARSANTRERTHIRRESEATPVSMRLSIIEDLLREAGIDKHRPKRKKFNWE